MKQEKRICFRITAHRIAGAIVIAATVVNLIIVGVVSAFSPPPSTRTQLLPTLTESAAGTLPPKPTDAPGSTQTFTPTETATETLSATPTSTATPTPTFTPLPSLTPCVSQLNWSIYIVHPGDTLFSLAQITGSTVSELMMANCLLNDRLYAGQLLYVPRVPVTITITPTFTPSVTPTNTTPPDTLTDFQNPNIFCGSSRTVSLSVLPSDPQGISSVTAVLMSKDGTVLDQISMGPDGATYYGFDTLRAYTVFNMDNYYFWAIDSLGNSTLSMAYYPEPSSLCVPTPTPSPTSTSSPLGTEATSTKAR